MFDGARYIVYYLYMPDIIKTPFKPLFQSLKAASKDKHTFIIAIDGRCASGKTTLAAILSKELGADVFHMDDFYLPFDKRTPQIMAQAAGHMDLERFKREILHPAKEGKIVIYKPFNCTNNIMLPGEVTVKLRPVVIIEGCYCQHPALAPFYDYKLFLTNSPQEQKKRILARNGADGLKRFEDKWIPAEEKYFKQFDIQAKADMIFDTSALW